MEGADSRGGTRNPTFRNSLERFNITLLLRRGFLMAMARRRCLPMTASQRADAPGRVLFGQQARYTARRDGRRHVHA